MIVAVNRLIAFMLDAYPEDPNTWNAISLAAKQVAEHLSNKANRPFNPNPTWPPFTPVTTGAVVEPAQTLHGILRPDPLPEAGMFIGDFVAEIGGGIFEE